MYPSIETIRPYDRVTARSTITINPTLTLVLSPIYIAPGILWLIGEMINDDLVETLNVQIEESWSASGPWCVALFNEMQTIVAGECRRFNLSTEARGPWIRVTATATGAGLSARRSFATASREMSKTR